MCPRIEKKEKYLAAVQYLLLHSNCFQYNVVANVWFVTEFHLVVDSMSLEEQKVFLGTFLKCLHFFKYENREENFLVFSIVQICSIMSVHRRCDHRCNAIISDQLYISEVRNESFFRYS